MLLLLLLVVCCALFRVTCCSLFVSVLLLPLFLLFFCVVRFCRPLFVVFVVLVCCRCLSIVVRCLSFVVCGLFLWCMLVIGG